jgi:hypothetical protein
MGWQRMTSAEEQRKAKYEQRERIRGFLPFTEGSQVIGTLEAIRVDNQTGKGFFIIRASEPCTVNVKDADSKTGQGKAVVGDLVGIRKTGATKRLSELPLETLVCVTYIGNEERTSLNPKTKIMETNPYHHLTIDVFKPEGQEAA